MTQTLTPDIESDTPEISFSVELLSAYCKAHEAYLTELIGLLKEFGEKRREEVLKLPYHLNVIDELHINENAHSRILHKILAYRDSAGEYPLLQSLVNQLAEKCPSFKNIHIEDPIITQEKERIDLWVRDKTYTLIFENKVYNAQDQDAQLSRYIDKSIRSYHNGHKQEDIYVVYMPQRAGEPSDQSWGEYKDSSIHKMRYVNFSFFDGVLPWLREKIISSSYIGYDTRDQIFHTAIKQYIDYLEGLFLLRQNQEPMNKTLENLITEKLQLSQCKDEFEKFEKLSEQYDECVTLSNKLLEMRQKAIKNYWHKSISEKFPALRITSKSEYIGVLIPIPGENKEGNIYVHIDSDSRVYCQVEFEDRRPINNTIVRRLKDENILVEANDHCVWTYFDKNPTMDVFKRFEDVIKWLIKPDH